MVTQTGLPALVSGLDASPDPGVCGIRFLAQIWDRMARSSIDRPNVRFLDATGGGAIHLHARLPPADNEPALNRLYLVPPRVVNLEVRR